jgi:hypothetical protein
MSPDFHMVRMNRTALALMSILCVASHAAAAQNPAFPQRNATIAHTIGDMPESDDYRFGAITSVGVTAAGRIYVLDAAKYVVRAYDDSGKFILKFGKKGSGNDEFLRPLDLVVEDSTVSVRDGGGLNGSGASARLITFSLDGKHLKTRNLTPDDITRRAVTTRGGVRVTGSQTVPTTINAARKDPQFFIMTVQGVSARKADTLLKVRADLAYLETDSNGSLKVPGFGNAGAWDISGDSALACVDGYSGVVRWYALAAAGATLRRTDSLHAMGATVTPAELKAREDVVNAAMMAGPAPIPGMPIPTATSGGRGGGGGGAAQLPSNGKLINTPTQWSIASEAHYGADGSVWIGAPRRTLTNPRNAASFTGPANWWVVFPRTGPAFQVELPLRFYIGGIGADGRIYGRQMASNGATTIVIYAVTD